jgi:RNA polymerase sigma-70 factor (ECF subfamily)
MASIRIDRPGAFDALFNRHRKRAYDYAFRVLFDGREAEDVVQEAFLRIYLAAQRGAFDPAKGRFETYLYRVLRNLCYDRMAARAKAPTNASDLGPTATRTEEDEPDFDARLTDATTPVERASGRLFRARVLAALEQLPPIQREVLTLRGFEGLTYREIARVIERPVSHVKIILFRARRALAIRLGTRWPDGVGGRTPAAAPVPVRASAPPVRGSAPAQGRGAKLEEGEA